MLKLLLTTALVGLIATPAFAQSTKDKLLALEEALNDPSPIIRLAAVEEALVDSSAAVRRYAQSQALASDDDDIKAMAIINFFQTRRQFSVLVGKSNAYRSKEGALRDQADITSFQRQSSYRILAGYTPSILYQIKSFNPVSGQINGYCMKNKTRGDDGFMFTGSIIGNKLTLQHECYGGPSGYRRCTLQMDLSDKSKFTGYMRCTNETYPAYVELPFK